MTTDSTNGNGKRTRRSMEEREAALLEDLARLKASKRAILIRTAERLMAEAQIFGESSGHEEGDPMASEAKAFAVRLGQWIERVGK